MTTLGSDNKIMKKYEIRIIQQHLVRDQRYDGQIDGKRGSGTKRAIDAALAKRASELPATWLSWSGRRRAVAYFQIICHDNDIDAGPIDGFYGPQTECASQRLKVLLDTGSLPRGFGDIIPVLANPLNFPVERFDELKQYYGNPCEITLVKVTCPWTLRLDWDLNSTTNTLSVHERLGDSLCRILTKAFDIYGIEGIKRHKLDRYGGSYNCRKKRDSVNAWSTHAWGIAIDWYPSKNKLQWGSDRASLAHPDLDSWWEIWEQEGWLSLGRSENRDWMHVQAAKR